MKHYIYLFFVLLAVGVSSCLGPSKSNYTPQINVSNFISGSDTLYVRYDSIQSRYNLTPIEVGDSVRFGVIFDALGNTLQSTIITWDTTYLSLEANLGIFTKNNVLNMEKSDTTMLRLLYNPGYTAAVIPIKMAAKQVTREASRMTFRIESDSEFSPQEVSLYITINEKKAK